MQSTGPGPRLARAALFGVVLLTAASTTSCAKKTGLGVHPAKGRVLINDKPAKDVFVYCHPKAVSADGAFTPTGQTDDDGRFTLSTYTENDGAPTGEYMVTVEWPEKYNVIAARWEGDRLKGRYSDPTKSTLKILIKEGPNELDTLTLKK